MVASGVPLARDDHARALCELAVDLASRMGMTGEPGRIQVPAATRALVADGFSWEERGVIEVKGRGPVETWYLIGRSEPQTPTAT